MWILCISSLIVQICSLGLQSVKAREGTIGQELIKKKRKPKRVAQYLQSIVEMQWYLLLVHIQQQTLTFFITAVGGVKWRGSGKAVACIVLPQHASVWKAAVVTWQTRRITAGLGIHPGRTAQLLQCQQDRVYKAARVNVLCPWDKGCCYTSGSALQPSKRAWEVMDHPGDHLN